MGQILFSVSGGFSSIDNFSVISYLEDLFLKLGQLD